MHATAVATARHEPAATMLLSRFDLRLAPSFGPRLSMASDRAPYRTTGAEAAVVAYQSSWRGAPRAGNTVETMALTPVLGRIAPVNAFGGDGDANRGSCGTPYRSNPSKAHYCAGALQCSGS